MISTEKSRLTFQEAITFIEGIKPEFASINNGGNNNF
jgi:hypothetical protein